MLKKSFRCLEGLACFNIELISETCLDGSKFGPFLLEEVLLNTPPGDPVWPGFCSDLRELGGFNVTSIRLKNCGSFFFFPLVFLI